MKKFFTALAILSLVLAAGAAHADPHLTCDPYQVTDGVTNFVLTIDGTAITTTQIVTDTAKATVSLNYDLANIAVGTHTLTAKACSTWGCSADSVPFVFTRPAALASPKNFILGK